ncbi:hypothetical protein DPMN_067681 [Dreissena polymorpha]|uniref:Uncharacterized protein n=1 Tax=Dreissena polymorpha TaxID=45954 RepID=A0A9D3Z0R3_DREPO|nr:hypothetical protein DPMN_067681 [Dreissena polymorpha]
MARQRPTRAPHLEIASIVIREVQYQLEVNRCRNEEIIVKDNFGWIDRIVIKDVQYQFEVNRCRNEEIKVKGNFGWAWPMWAGHPGIDLSVIREAQYQFEFQGSSANSVGEAGGQDGRTEGQTHINTITSLFSPKNVGGM